MEESTIKTELIMSVESGDNERLDRKLVRYLPLVNLLRFPKGVSSTNLYIYFEQPGISELLFIS